MYIVSQCMYACITPRIPAHCNCAARSVLMGKRTTVSARRCRQPLSCRRKGALIDRGVRGDRNSPASSGDTTECARRTQNRSHASCNYRQRVAIHGEKSKGIPPIATDSPHRRDNPYLPVVRFNGRSLGGVAWCWLILAQAGAFSSSRSLSQSMQPLYVSIKDHTVHERSTMK